MEATPAAELPSWKTRDLVLHIGEIPTKAAAVNMEMRIQYRLFQEFRSQFPNVEFTSATPLQFIGIEGGGSNRLLLQMASQTAPVIIGFPVKAFDNYCDQNFMLPLNPYIEREEFAWVRDYLDRYKVLTDVLTRDGQVYAIPTAVRTMGIHYRKDMFRAAGVAHPPRTWDEFYETLVKIRDRERGIYGWTLPNTGAGAAWWFINFLWQSGTEIIENTPDGPRAVFDNEKGAEALDFLRKIAQEDLVLRSSTYADYFSRGRVAMFFSYVGSDSNTPGESADVDPLLLGVAPLPVGPRGDSGAEINGAMLAINSQITDPDEQEVAFRLLVHYISPASRRLVMEEYARAGLAKYYTRDALLDVGLDEYVDQVSPEWDSQAREILESARPEPHGSRVRLIYEIMGYYIDKALSDPSLDSLALLRECADNFNQKLGAIPPEENQRRHRNTGITMGIAILGWVGFVFIFGRMLSGALKTGAQGALTAEGRNRRRLRVTLSAWAFMLPALLLILIWSYYPLGRGSLMAFQDFRILGESRFTGIENFVNALYGDTFRIALYNTFLYAALSLGMGFFVPILLAIALDEIPKYKRLFRTVYYMPAVTTGLVILFLWKWFYDGSEAGLVNQIMASLAPVGQFIDSVWLKIWGEGATPLFGPYKAIDWLNDPRTILGFIPIPMVAIILPGIWAGAGPGCLIYLAALKSIPDELYEAAEMDGAGFLRKIWTITLPMLLPLILISFIGAFVGTFQSMGNILVMTGGGPQRMTHVLGLEIWYAAFMHLEFGYATAVAWIVGSMLIGFTIFQLNILRKAQFRSAHKVEV